MVRSMYSYCSATMTEVFSVLFPQLYGKCQGITRQDGARPAVFLNFCVVLCIFLSFCVLCVCKCVLYYCHRVATQLQCFLANSGYANVTQCYCLPCYHQRSSVIGTIHVRTSNFICIIRQYIHRQMTPEKTNT
jgi:hypothetical protein